MSRASINNAFSFVLASDLHTEFVVRKDASGRLALGTLFEPKAPFLALVGDVGAPIRDVEPYRQVLQAASATFQHVWLLSGNHEFYNPSSRYASGTKCNRLPDLDILMNCQRCLFVAQPVVSCRHVHCRSSEKQVSMEAVKQQMRSLCAEFPNVSYMDRDSGPQWVTPAGEVLTSRPPSALRRSCIRVVGCTLWSRVPQYAQREVVGALNDYALIAPPPPEPPSPAAECTAAGAAADERSGARSAGAAHAASECGYDSPGAVQRALGRREAAEQKQRRRENAVFNMLAQEHEADLAYLYAQVQESTRDGEAASVILTHHAPTFHRTSHPRFGGPVRSAVSHAFASGCEHLFAGFGSEAPALGAAAANGGVGVATSCERGVNASLAAIDVSAKTATGPASGASHSDASCATAAAAAASATAATAAPYRKGSNSNVAVWAYGHTHYNNDQLLHGTRVVSNQRGYSWAAGGKGEDMGRPFDPGFVVSVRFPDSPSDVDSEAVVWS